MGELVRDRIPEIIRENGEPSGYHADRSTNRYSMRNCSRRPKELQRSRSDEEFANVLEVVGALAELYGIDTRNAQQIRWRKKTGRGGFGGEDYSGGNA